MNEEIEPESHMEAEADTAGGTEAIQLLTVAETVMVMVLVALNIEKLSTVHILLNAVVFATSVNMFTCEVPNRLHKYSSLKKSHNFMNYFRG